MAKSYLKKPNKNNTTGIVGVSYRNITTKTPWHAYGYVNGRKIRLGNYKSKTAAKNARRKWEKTRDN